MPKPCSAEFFKIFLPHNLTTQKLLIPPDYVKHFSRTIQERITLKDIGGKSWHVEVERTLDRVFITGEWQSFASHHCLNVGDFLVFRYDGCYSFEVKIFGTNGCSKGTFPAKNIETPVRTEKEIDEPELNTRKRARLDDEDHRLRGRDRIELSRDAGLEEDELNEKNVNLKSSKNCTDVENADSAVMARPYVVQSPSKSQQYRLRIPDKISDRLDIHFKSEMVLRNESGMEWPVRFYRSDDGRKYIGRGLSEFRKGNKVGFEDSCKFTFNTASNVIDVKILSSTKEEQQPVKKPLSSWQWEAFPSSCI